MTQSYPFKSTRFDDKIFVLDVKKNYEMGEVPLNIRFIQFYEEYLSGTDQEFYKYSPVLMELYD